MKLRNFRIHKLLSHRIDNRFLFIKILNYFELLFVLLKFQNPRSLNRWLVQSVDKLYRFCLKTDQKVWKQKIYIQMYAILILQMNPVFLWLDIFTTTSSRESSRHNKATLNDLFFQILKSNYKNDLYSNKKSFLL